MKPIFRHTACALLGIGIALGAGLTPPVAAAPASFAPYHLIKTVPLPGDGGWDYLAVDSAARRVYITHSTHVSVVDLDTGAVIGDIADTSGVHGVAVDPKSGHGFTSNGRSSTVTMFDLKTLKPLKQIPVGDGPDAIEFDPASRRVFTFNGQAQSSTAIDAATGMVVGTISLPGRPEFAVADGKGHLYNNIEDKSQIADINARTLKVEHVWPTAPGEAPSGLTMDLKTRRLFSVCDNQKLVVMDADTGKVVSTPIIGNGPDAVRFDPATHLVFSPNGEDGTMTILKEQSPNSYAVVQTLTTQKGARTMALDEKTHRVLTVTAAPLPAAPGANPRRRSYVPGSFVLLEYGN